MNARLIAPGDSEHSLLAYRMNLRDSAAMPPVGSRLVDAEGVALIAEWIDALTSCQ